MASTPPIGKLGRLQTMHRQTGSNLSLRRGMFCTSNGYQSREMLDTRMAKDCKWIKIGYTLSHIYYLLLCTHNNPISPLRLLGQSHPYSLDGFVVGGFSMRAAKAECEAGFGFGNNRRSPAASPEYLLRHSHWGPANISQQAKLPFLTFADVRILMQNLDLDIY